MVRPIIVQSGDRTFYGTREAGYILHFPHGERLKEFANELEDSIIKINRKIEDPYYQLSLVSAGMTKKISLSEERKEIESKLLFSALKETSNIWIRPSNTNELVANLVSGFLDEDSHRDRFLRIYSYSIPNSEINFDPSFLYELGEKYGRLVHGEDFDITLSNYKEINN